MTRKGPITTEIDARRTVDLRREPDDPGEAGDDLPASSPPPMRQSSTVAKPRQPTPRPSLAKRAVLDSEPPPTVGSAAPPSRAVAPKNPTLPWGLPKVSRAPQADDENGVARHLAWLDGERRVQLEVALGRNDFARAVTMLDEERNRFPKNLTIVKAIQAVEAAARAYWSTRIGSFDRVPIRVGSLPRGRVSAEHTILKLADGVATIEDILRVSPFPDHRTLEALADLAQKGVISSRPPPKKSSDAPPAGPKSLSLPPLGDDPEPRESPPPDLPRSASIDGIRFSPRPPNVTPRVGMSIAELIAEANQEMGRETLPDPVEVLTRAAMTREDPPTTRPNPREASALEDDDVPEILKPSSLAPAPAIASRLPASLDPAASRDIPTPPEGSTTRRRSLADDAAPSSVAAMAASLLADEARERDSVIPAAPPRFARFDDVGSPNTSRSATPSAPMAAPPREGPRLSFVIMLVLAGLAAAASATALYLVVRRPNEVPQPPPPAATAAPKPTSTAVATQTASAPASTSVPTMSTLALHIELTPPHARIFLDDVLLTKPYDAVIPKTGRVHNIRAEALGYKTRKTTFVANGDTNLIIALDLLPPVPRPEPQGDPYPTEP